MNIPTFARSIAQTGILKGKKHAPEILVGVGVVGVVIAAVLASKATLQLETALDDIRDNVDTVKEIANDNNESPSRDLAMVYARGTFQIAKLYAPSVTLGAASIASILGGHGILKRRNVAVMAAYKVLEESHNEYRRRFIEEFGEEKDAEFRRGITTTKVKDETTGKTKTEKVFDPNGLSHYAKLFEETNPNWEKVPERNLMFVTMVQNHCNEKLRANGFLLLNEVYEALGIERTQAGCVVGWIKNGEEGDNFVDFGIYDPRNAKAVNHGTSRADGAFLLDFNVDGLIYDKI